MITTKISTLPKKPGVYLFKDKTGKVMYVGKSTNIQDRIKSHFASFGEKTKSMISISETIDFVEVESELEALLLEAKLIKSYFPKFNSAAKDDKSPLYIYITREKLPVVGLGRLSDIKDSINFGPFPSSRTVKSVLKQIRKIFPYHSTTKQTKRPCLYSHIGLCNPCPVGIVNSDNDKAKDEMEKQYNTNIKRILELLKGKSKSVRKVLEKEMDNASKEQNFEKAAKLRDQISNLDYITSPYTKPTEYLKNPDLLEDQRQEEVNRLYEILSPRMNNLHKPVRIECFDNSHTGGRDATSSMVTFINGEPHKNYYRHFKLYKAKARDDFSSMKEVISRRLKHIEDWGTPDLIIVDGGKGQVTAAIEAMSEASVEIPLIGLAKRLEEIILPREQREFAIIRLREDNPGLHLLQRLRDESHRFARKLHFKLRMRSL